MNFLKSDSLFLLIASLLLVGCSLKPDKIEKEISRRTSSKSELRKYLGDSAVTRESQVAPGAVQTIEHIYYFLDSRGQVQARRYNYRASDGKYETTFYENFDFSGNSHLIRILNPLVREDNLLIERAKKNGFRKDAGVSP